MKTRDSKGQNERWRGTNFVPQISVWFSEIIYCFFFWYARFTLCLLILNLLI